MHHKAFIPVQNILFKNKTKNKTKKYMKRIKRMQQHESKHENIYVMGEGSVLPVLCSFLVLSVDLATQHSRFYVHQPLSGHTHCDGLSFKAAWPPWLILLNHIY